MPKFRMTRSHWKHLGFLLILLAVAPFAIEFLFLAEFVGLEFAVTFMVLYFKTLCEELNRRWWKLKYKLKYGFDELIDLFVFQPRTYGVSATASCVVILLTGSTLVACAIWLPAMMMSSGYI